MSLNVTLQTAASGLNAAQASLRAVSDNIANVNTPGYVRKAVVQQPLVVDGVGMGVRVQGMKRITDDYLQSASLTAASDSSRWAAVAQYLDNAQSLFGDPSSPGFFFSRLDEIYGAFATAADDPSSSLLRSQSIANIQDFLAEADRINSQLSELGGTVETRITADIDRANDLLAQVDRLNAEISRAKMVNADASGSENIQSQLLDELSSLMNVRVARRAEGGVTVRSTEGVLLAGEGGSATLSYVRSDSTPGYISAKPSGGGTDAQPIQIASGEIRGLMDLRDQELPKLQDQLGEFLTRAVDQLNAAHNASVAYPAPSTLTGRNTGLDLPTAVGGFSGATTLAVMDANGVLVRRVDVDFTAGTMSANGGPAVAFTPGTFLATLNTQLGGQATASFTGGTLSIAGAGANTLAVDEGTSQKAGRGFSHFFGLNDLVRSNGFTNYDTGLRPTDPHGFTAGDPITLRLSSPDGLPLRDITIPVPAGTQMSDLVNALNSSATGVGLYGSFSLDAQGALTFQGAPPTNAQVSVVTDNTQRGAGGPSISQLFGLGAVERSNRAGRFQVDGTLDADPTRLALGKLDFSGGFTLPAIRPGDGRGALALSQAGDVATRFQAAGSLGQVNMTVSRYASEFGGSIGRNAASAETRKESAAAVLNEATARRQSVEGVNLDEELVNMTTYQQAFNASARMVQAAKDLFDVLLGMV
ncbi:flagellar hook-associated protein [Phenylobacterium zucineum HLK1]|uniref:Flagellar hook-associated protein 1 n=1 Tax=Phenylobacterium zucineum (strain HLK1) TaxID=450851 RepID=B4RG80_PHEZH|nr:flagellar hook-associated protein FlgK [Phenylobacterium zucineum]ACG77204.1 flagellar hook-associated protein [Phenylobacterium zucineum HLK1]